MGGMGGFSYKHMSGSNGADPNAIEVRSGVANDDT